MRIILTIFLFLSSFLSFSQSENTASYESNFKQLLSESLISYNRKELDSVTILYNSIDTMHQTYQKDRSYFFKREFIQSFILVLENDYSLAVEKLLACDRFFSQEKDSAMLALNNYQLGKTVYYMRNRENSKSYFEKALKLQKYLEPYYTRKVQQYIVTIDLEITQLKKEQYSDKEYKSLLENIASEYEQTLWFYEKNQKYFDYSQLSSLLAGCYSEIGQYKKALQILDQGIAYTKQSNNLESKAFAIVKRSQTLNKMGRYNEAYKEIQQAKKTYKTLNDLGMLIYAFVVEKDALTGLKQFEKASTIGDSIHSVTVKLYDTRLADKVTEFEAKYETEKKEKELLEVKAEKATTELNLSNQRFITYGLVTGLLVLILIGFTIVQRNKQRHQLALSEQKEQNLQSIIIAEEKERTRIARELHDGIVQQIGASIIKSRNTFKKLGISDTPESSELLKDLETSSSELRSISHQMMPRALEEKGFIIALEGLLKNSLTASNIQYSFEHLHVENRLPKNLEITLYRITQELIQNIVKHSQATEVNVQLMKVKNQILYLVEDNGVGFQSTKQKGIGLKNIQSRIDLLKGSVTFDSEHSGTLTTIKIPL